MKTIGRILTINRMELFPGSVLSVIWPILLVSLPLSSFLSLPVALSFAACLLFRHSGYALNAGWDYELDKGNPHKKKLVDAIGAIGKNRTFQLGVLEIAIAACLFTIVTMDRQEHAIWFVIIFVAELINICLYNHPKTKFKSRGILNALCLMIRGVTPILLAWISLNVELNSFYALIAIGISIEYISSAIFASMFDYKFDKNEGCKTFPVLYGLNVSMLMHIFLRILGPALLIFGWYKTIGTFELPVMLLTFAYIYSSIGFIAFYLKSNGDILGMMESPQFKKASFSLLGLMGLPKLMLTVSAVLTALTMSGAMG